MGEVSLTVTESGYLSQMQQVFDLVRRGLKGGPVRVTLGREKRSLEQNKKLWACLSDVSRQVQWHGEKMDPESWKHVFTAALKGQKVVPGIDGRLVVLGYSTRQMSKPEMAELIEAIYAFGAEQNVMWSDDADIPG